MHITLTSARRRSTAISLACATVMALAACSKTASDTPAPSAATSAPTSVGVAPTIAPTPGVAPAPTVVAQNDSAYAQGRRDQRHSDERRDERGLQPRADRDADLSQTQQQREARHDHAQIAAAACPNCGVVESINAVKVQGQTNGVGAVAGGVGGALIGNRIAGGGNRTLGGIVGAVGGGLLGNAIEKHERTETVYEVQVRMNDGSLRTVREATSPAVGEKVLVESDGLHARS